MKEFFDFISKIKNDRIRFQNWDWFAKECEKLLKPNDWSDKYMLVSFTTGSHYSYLLDHMSQEEFFEWLLGNFGIPAVFNSFIELTEESFEALEDRYESKGRVLRGEE